ncbi:alkyl hydroperoxide reductase/thiol specific antioxidant/Mal allergen [Leptotrichia shahii]|uniref:Alkyl hydroperoxide reductase/thiol specific antioxidant/Mal allergen n=1 Tax=Leptotrichia shahii TaxID=157691 RepID=A0A510JRT4_9FUSO|nr:TlpA disulfide reductase family protein [Leptotrichia shahii]BBM41181.1 alkyl hydroperoxide reductase/thiol specific antioxidant/Mal allergen [Leptotrichia shahii]
MKKILLIVSMFMIFMIGYGKGKPLDVNMENGSKIPSFQLRDFNGKYTNSKKIFNNGKPTLLIFAAEWCPHCRSELPDIQKFYEENKENVNVVVVFTRRKTNLSSTKKYVEESKFTFPVYFDADDSLMTGFKVKTVPYNIKIENSKIQEILGGTMQYDAIKSAFYVE